MAFKNPNILVRVYSDPFVLVVPKIRAPLTTTFMQGPISIIKTVLIRATDIAPSVTFRY